MFNGYAWCGVESVADRCVAMTRAARELVILTRA